MDAAAALGCLIAVFAWGAAGLFDKLGVRGADPFAAVLVRMVFGTLMVLVLCLATGRMRHVTAFPPTTYAFLAGSALFGALVGQLAYYVAIKHAPVSLVVPVTATYPVVAALLAVLVLKEQPTVGKFVGVLLVVAGLALVSGAGSKPNSVSVPETSAGAGRVMEGAVPESDGVPLPAADAPESESP
ncbi:MAG: DMT family transporter [Armatimonadetes bacterium]|nr:DMT family transporter [Armatimonadota bacterium]